MTVRPLLPLLLLLACGPDKTSGESAEPEETGETGETGEPAETGETGETGTENLATQVVEALESALTRDLRNSYATGASVSVWMDDTFVSLGIGNRHPDDATMAVSTDTLFQIGSDTKKLTALAVLQRVEAGEISLDDPLSVALPELSFALDPSWSEDITVHDLLSHQGGLYDYTPWDDAPSDEELASRAYGRFAENEYAMAPPGEFWNYCNPGFSLAGLVAEEAAGRMYGDLLEDDLFAPLDMTRSFARMSDVETDDDYATGYGVIISSGADSFDGFGGDASYALGTLEMADQVDNGFTRPAGLVWSTATDMMRLAKFLVDGDEEIISDALREQISTAQVPLYPTVPGQSYGYGLMILDGFNLGSDFYEVPLWTHGGNTLTMTSTLYILPEQRFGISILSNGYGDDFTNTVVAAIMELAELPAPGTAPEYEAPGDLESYVGTYRDEYGLGEITLSYDGTDLLASVPLLEEYGYTVEPVLEPVIKDLFYLYVDGVPYDLTFIDGTDGSSHQFMRNRLFVATRVDGSEARPAPPVAGPDEVLRRVLMARAEPRGARALLPGRLGAAARGEGER